MTGIDNEVACGEVPAIGGEVELPEVPAGRCLDKELHPIF